ncbi:hypothetical protein [Stackebrandtia soli]|uniref:hypothetical protein n=1 Tax=Stackebrandtia soli TaxID=1892856 RepID=UPI0039E92A5F
MKKRLRAAIVVGSVLAATIAVPSVAHADPTVPTHAVIVCESASFYDNYDSASGPVGLKRTLGYGNKVGHTRGAHPVYNGWAATFDFGPNDWGFVRIECLGGFGSW